MRLTLRTMLAYLDDVLEPADAQELGKKIAESEFATGLVQRLRSSVRRLRLGAPALSGEAEKLDCNSVAEYLDNTLPPERVPDFEKVCLESELHLAEVAACHQVLTLVLGEPAEVEPSTRERVYRIGSENDSRRAAGAGVDQPAEPPAPAPKSDMSTAAVAASRPAVGTTDEADGKPAGRQKLEVPDYLKPSSRLRFWPIAITLLLALMLVGAAVMALGPDMVKKWFGGGGPAVATVGANAQQTPDGGLPPETPGRDAIAGGIAGGAVGGSPAGTPLKQPRVVAPGQPAGVGEIADVAAPGSGDAALPADRGGARTVIEGGGAGAAATVPESPATGEGPPPGGDDSASPAGTRPSDQEVAKVDPLDSRSADQTMVERVAPDEGEAPAAAAVDVGRFTSDQEILIRFDSAAEEWSRVPTRNTVRAGDRLLALPTFRPQLLLVNGIQMTLDGPTALHLAAPDESGVLWVHVEYGRLLLVTVGKAGAQLGLQFGERRGVLAFRDADTTAALSVRRFQLPGIDPESQEPHTRTELYATSGLVQWQQSGDAAVEVAAGQMRTFVDTIWAETLDASESPRWIGGSDVSEIDQRASLDLRTELSGNDAGVSLRLVELAEHRRPEVRSLAVRCGAYLDEFEPSVRALNDPNQKSFWSAEVDVLGESIHRGPATASRVRQTLENHRAGDAQNLYRLLWGFSEEELKSGWDARLVEYLDHESLDFRVMAIENLRRITNRTLLYRAEYAPDRRRSHVQRWSEQLNSGGIRYEKPPISIPEPAGPSPPAADATAPATVPKPARPAPPVP